MGFWIMLISLLFAIFLGYYAFRSRENNRAMAIILGIIALLFLIFAVYLA
ncbi:MAG: hypothetical protein ABF679_11355 [Lentilactobacillus diolivorans]|jgi:threonine/homoserine/homoserine lactone efflux protein|uniref:Exosortase n=1 Tax=Lentilactobacillus diolivorans TaxID=179838 RepID=A0ABQ0XDE4_9LACO|nr:hypothetical protein [Lentilactobacillus diolivorans]MCH4164513.1 hypothetical protein [Lentilactobacillus diolivorans]MDH5105239.1 hypothetical protein [Lentilactobacillus diolivorans]GEP23684.1 hypothetical protein LDI01_12770 [Lentilactobacillus diolivorans]